MIATLRTCEACSADISHKRSDARFCNRACKCAGWHRANRATEDGKQAERERNRARYAGEAQRRRAEASAYYAANQPERVEYSRSYRRRNPHRRRAAADVRAARMRANPGFVPFTDREWLAHCRLYDHRCAYCGASGPLEQDHVIPLVRGGRHALANMVPACGICNRSKSSSLLSEWRLRQRRR